MISMQLPLFQGLHCPFSDIYVHEVHTSIMLEASLSKYHERQAELEALQVNSQSEELTGKEWNATKEHADTIQAALYFYIP